MNKIKKNHTKTFEIFEQDYEILYTHAWLAKESGSISGNSKKKFELESKYIIKQLPRLHEYFMIENGRLLVNHGERNYKGSPKKSIFKIRLPIQISKQYYELQHRYDRSWVLNALINIYEHRQIMKEDRERSELCGSFLNYQYPFDANEWKFSFLGCLEQGLCKGYHINLHETIFQTVDDYLRLSEVVN